MTAWASGGGGGVAVADEQPTAASATATRAAARVDLRMGHLGLASGEGRPQGGYASSPECARVAPGVRRAGAPPARGRSANAGRWKDAGRGEDGGRSQAGATIASPPVSRRGAAGCV